MPDAVRALRGATTLDEDTPAQMHARVSELMSELYARNGLTHDAVISAFLTATPDLRSMFPAKAARDWGLADVPLMGAQELDVDGGVPRCVRVMLHVETDKPRHELFHVFLHGARALRPDLVDE